MGRGTILADLGEGQYTIKLDFGESRLAAQILLLTGANTDLDTQIAAQQAKVTAAQAALNSSNAALAAAINAYVAGNSSPNLLLPVEAAKLDQVTKEEALRKETVALGKLQGSKANNLRKIDDLNSYRASLTLNAWCADYTEGASGEVATLEIPNEPKTVLIAPTGRAPVDADGELRMRALMTAPQAYYNAAILPGWQKFKPTYRSGTITAINGDTADVALDEAKSSAGGIADIGLANIEFDVNQTSTLTNVPIVYQDCNGTAFEVGDEVVVQFMAQSWSTPRIIGFLSNPKVCHKTGWRIGNNGSYTLSNWNSSSYTWIDGVTPTVGENTIWCNTSGKVISWYRGNGRLLKNGGSFNTSTVYYKGVAFSFNVDQTVNAAGMYKHGNSWYIYALCGSSTVATPANRRTSLQRRLVNETNPPTAGALETLWTITAAQDSYGFYTDGLSFCDFSRGESVEFFCGGIAYRNPPSDASTIRTWRYGNANGWLGAPFWNEDGGSITQTETWALISSTSSTNTYAATRTITAKKVLVGACYHETRGLVKIFRDYSNTAFVKLGNLFTQTVTSRVYTSDGITLATASTSMIDSAGYTATYRKLLMMDINLQGCIWEDITENQISPVVGFNYNVSRSSNLVFGGNNSTLGSSNNVTVTFNFNLLGWGTTVNKTDPQPTGYNFTLTGQIWNLTEQGRINESSEWIPSRSTGDPFSACAWTMYNQDSSLSSMQYNPGPNDKWMFAWSTPTYTTFWSMTGWNNGDFVASDFTRAQLSAANGYTSVPFGMMGAF